MSVDITPAAREREQQPPDYSVFCLVRDAALRIQGRTETLPKTASGERVTFSAIGVSTNLPDQFHAPMCRNISIDWHRYGRKEQLLIEITERVLGSAASEGYGHQFCIRTKLQNVTNTWQRLAYPDYTNTEHESVTDATQVLEALEGAAALEGLLKGIRTVLIGDCTNMIKELDAFPLAA